MVDNEPSTAKYTNMAQNIRWQIPFVSLDGVHYRVDIYDEGTFTPVQLTAGSTPFVTNEDASDDFYCPVRHQTGTLQVCTKLPNGGMIDLNDLLPANNLEHPVRLISIASNNSETIEWQGFLSCEAYSQDYIGIPQIIDLPVISVLEAMRSMFISKDTFESLGTIGCLLARTMNAISFNKYTSLYIPQTSWDILNKCINISSLFSKSEYQNRDRVAYKLQGISLYDVIEMICGYMGWTAREQGRELFFQLQQGDGNVYILDVNTLIEEDGVDSDWFIDGESTTADMATDLATKWRGTGHMCDFRQGAYSVSVTANLEEFDVNIHIPDLPFGDLFEAIFHQIGLYYVYILASMDDNAYSNLVFGHYKADIQISSSSITCGAYSSSSSDLTIEYSIPVAGSLSPAYITYQDRNTAYTNYAGAFLARMQFDDYNDPDYQHQNTEDGLYISLFGGVWQEHTVYSNPIFQMKSVQVFAAYEEGYINLDAQVRAFWNDLSIENPDSQTKLMIDVRIGDKVWTGNQWVDASQHVEHFFIGFDDDKFEKNWSASMGIDEVDGLCIPIDKSIKGEIVLSIYPETKKRTDSTDMWRRTVYGIFFSKLDVTYIPKKDVRRTDRKNNTYYKELGTAFRDIIDVNVNLASWLHNAPSPSLLFNPDGTLMETIEYVEGDDIKNMPPEVDFLNRLASYYGSVRKRLELEVKHLTMAPLPLLKLNGFDGKVYLPLSESRDWQKDVCKLTCFEMPEEPSES